MNKFLKVCFWCFVVILFLSFLSWSIGIGVGFYNNYKMRIARKTIFGITLDRPLSGLGTGEWRSDSFQLR